MCTSHHTCTDSITDKGTDYLPNNIPHKSTIPFSNTHPFATSKLYTPDKLSFCFSKQSPHTLRP